MNNEIHPGVHAHRADPPAELATSAGVARIDYRLYDASAEKVVSAIFASSDTSVPQLVFQKSSTVLEKKKSITDGFNSPSRTDEPPFSVAKSAGYDRPENGVESR